MEIEIEGSGLRLIMSCSVNSGVQATCLRESLFCAVVFFSLVCVFFFLLA